jgi:hypothetical protein
MSQAKASELRRYFSKAGFGVGPVYPPDRDDDEPNDWKFWVYAQRGRASMNAQSALGEIHVTPRGVFAEGLDLRSSAHPIVQELLRR